MLKHHLKIALRNLRKYKAHNIISIIGLAVGFTCFAFSALWIRYEMSYDNFHANADRIYRVNIALFKWDTQGSASSEINPGTPYPLAYWLKSNFPEIEDAGAMQIVDGRFSFLNLDRSFSNIFDMPLPQDFFIEGRTDRPIAVTHSINNEETAEAIKELYGWDVKMSIPDWSANTNMPFNAVVPITYRFNDEQLSNWRARLFETFILARNGIDMQALEEKLDKVEIPELWSNPISLVLTPLQQLRYNDPTGNLQSDIKFSHIQIFAIAGLLVILSSLFNHLTLYVTHVRMRLRELALRKVHGATDRQIAATLYSDFLLIIMLSLVVGFTLLSSLLPTFREYADVGANNINIYAELMVYAILLIVCGFIAGGIPILFFHKQVLDECIKGSGNPSSRNLFRKGSLLIQLIISLGMMFCAAVFIKQIHFLNHTDLGINRRNVVAVQAVCCPLPPHYADRIMQIPGVTDALPIIDGGFLRNMHSGTTTMNNVIDGERESVTVFMVPAFAHFFDFFGIEMIEGTGIYNDDVANNRVFNETAKEELGEFLPSHMGIARDFYVMPTIKARPSQIFYMSRFMTMFRAIAYRYEDGMREQTEQNVTQWYRNEFPEHGEFEIRFAYMEDIFDEYFKSERALIRLLSVMTLACILIAIFGVYSLTSLTCQQRRKEIAIRKVYGAETLDIMNIFFKEYLILLAMAALVAFPAGFLIMKPWLENYVKQTSIDAWLYVAIFLVVFAVIVVSIFSIVWKAANRNPAEVVKGE